MRFIELPPGNYLFRTRIAGPKALVSYLWLEVLPWTLMLWSLVGWNALWFPIAHWGFLGLYEIGYLHNDLARTADERRDRPAIAGITTWSFVAARVFFFGLVVLMLYLGGRAIHAAYLSAGAAVVLGLLFAHTWLGGKVQKHSPLRWAIFGWLAALKYLPGVLACLVTREIPTLISCIFVCYGGGRVVEYAISKHRGTVIFKPVDINACWFATTLPVSVALIVSSDIGSVLLIGIATIGSHYIVRFVWNMTRFRRVAA